MPDIDGYQAIFVSAGDCRRDWRAAVPDRPAGSGRPRAKTKLKPSHYARRIYADSVVFRQDALEMAVRVFGSENVMYGSDCPHTIGDPIGCLARVDALSDGVRERVRGTNARRVFAL